MAIKINKLPEKTSSTSKPNAQKIHYVHFVYE